MAQVILSTAGQALGGPVGRVIGSVIGRAVDRTFINSLSPARQVGPRLSGLQLNQSSQGDPVKQVFGRARVNAALIWAARLTENRNKTRASKTSGATESFSYSLSFAAALCEGPIDGIGRIWADGQLLDQSQIAYRLYAGGEDQMPDALIEAVEGTAPAYRGTAYLVFEDLDITPFGNRPPNLSVEVFRRPKGDDLESLIDGVCLIPGAGEFVCATTPVAALDGLTRAAWQNRHTGDGRADFTVALDQLAAQLPNVRRVNLVVSWFGTSVDAGTCLVRPGVETADKTTTPMGWSVAGYDRASAHLISTIDGRATYGGTPADAAVIEAIAALKARGYKVTLLPFVLMDCTGYPWRGRISSGADGTAGAAADVATFMSEFGAFVRHCADLSVTAGGVDAVLLGSELRGLTTLRDGTGAYPMVATLQTLAAEVRAIVGASTQIGYAADWSEYFGHQPADGSGDVHFHLDPLWADANIDFVGIDWYAPLSDWRHGEAHLDYALATSIYDPAYMQSRIRGGEGFDWYYASDADRAAQVRTPIHDGAYGEDWVFRPKDIAAWWANAHHDRPGGVRSSTPTAWVPQSKPIRFIEIGCGAIDKGPNAPNLFLDPKSSESAIPPFSNGERDDRAQRAYLEAFYRFYAGHNPISTVYHAPMLRDLNVWCWDARPYPYFPQRADVWGDALNWRTGHWLNGRVGSGEARSLIAAIAAQAGVTDIALDEVSGNIDGYVIDGPMRAAEALSPVLDWLGLELAEQGAGLRVVATTHGVDLTLTRDDLAFNDQNPVMARRELVEVPTSLSLRAYDLDRDYQLQSVTVRRDEVAGASQTGIDMPLCISAVQAAAFAHYALEREQSVRGTVQLDIDPWLTLKLETGDGVAFEGLNYRVTRIDRSETPSVTLEPVPDVRVIGWADPSAASARPGEVTVPVMTALRVIELPCFGADEANARPVLVAAADPWGGADVYAGAGPSSLKLRGRVEQMAGLGRAVSALVPQQKNVLLREAFVDVYLEGADPLSRTLEEVLSGENFVCVRADNGEWEVIQYLNSVATEVNTWRLSGLVRGQWGSEGALAAGSGAGADVVLLPAQIVRADMTLDELNLERLWRAGRPGFGGAADGALSVEAAWTGLALRPRAPVHGLVTVDGGDLRLSWIRVARYGGDSWDTEPPLCEDYERYRVRVWNGDVLKREAEVTAPAWTYAGADAAADFPGGLGAARAEIAQMSQVYGWGAVLSVGLG